MEYHFINITIAILKLMWYHDCFVFTIVALITATIVSIEAIMHVFHSELVLNRVLLKLD